MQRVVQTTGVSRSAGALPVLRRVAALPTARGETQNLAGHATTLQSCRNHFARQKRDLDRLAAHGAGIVDQDHDRRVAKFRFHFLLVCAGEARIDHHAIEARRVHQALVEIKGPIAQLARHQFALQAGDDTGEVALEFGAAAIEVGPRVARRGRIDQFRGVDHEIMGGRVNPIFARRRESSRSKDFLARVGRPGRAAVHRRARKYRRSRPRFAARPRSRPRRPGRRSASGGVEAFR